MCRPPLAQSVVAKLWHLVDEGTPVRVGRFGGIIGAAGRCPVLADYRVGP
jgi:hypothetical protein